jgi:hypothetical protein
MSDFFLVKNYADAVFASDDKVNHEAAANDFMNSVLQPMNDAEFEKLLITTGFIPDLYKTNSSMEKLFSKLIEALVCEWAVRIGASGELIRQKSSIEDVKIVLNESVVVCDAKSFRLGRSQQAPNSKDFLKLEDVRKWMRRYPNAIGGLVTYPCKHEWTGDSDTYQSCSTKNAATIMLPYKYLAYLLCYKGNYSPDDLIELWNYESLFPGSLAKGMAGGNKAAYWNVINDAITRITNTDNENLSSYMTTADNLINMCVAQNLEQVKTYRKNLIDDITALEANETDIAAMRERFVSYQIEKETEPIDKIIQRIEEFR